MSEQPFWRQVLRALARRTPTVTLRVDGNGITGTGRGNHVLRVDDQILVNLGEGREIEIKVASING